MCAISSLTSTFAISSPDEFLYVILIDSSTGSPVHVLMLSIQAVRGLPRQRAPGVVPCIISFSSAALTNAAPSRSLYLSTQTDDACVDCLESFMCLSVCLSVYPHDISKIDAASITKLDTVMVHHES